MAKIKSKERCVAVITGAFSIAIAVIYLILITVLDARGPMLPPPPEALGVAVTVFSDPSVMAQQLFEMPNP